MSTPAENFDFEVDESASTEDRKDAIHGLEVANECERLAELAQREDLDGQYRELAVSGLAEPQCKTKLEALLESGDLPDSLAERAESSLQETPDSTGGGP